jgi:hypothetical protein
MKLVKIIFFFLMMSFAVISPIFAGDFGWTEVFNIQAEADPSGFKARLSARFNLGDVQVKAIISNFDTPADAYIALKLGEISGRPISYVIDISRQNKDKGWGNLARSLGIKPGSREFQNLKNSQDLYGFDKHIKVSDDEKERRYANKVDNIYEKTNGRGKNKK